MHIYHYPALWGEMRRGAFEVAVYFVISYALMLGLTAVLSRARFLRNMRTGRRRGWLSVLAALLLLLPLLPYGIVGYLTYRYVDSVRPAMYGALTDLGTTPEGVRSVRVMGISDYEASVLVVYTVSGNRGYAVADIVSLKKLAGHWSFAGDYATVWSDGGNADGNTFPPYLD